MTDVPPSPAPPSDGRPVQLFLASTLYGAATLAAALDAGRFGERSAHRRLLLVATTSAIPETAVPLDEMPGFAALRPRFDAVLDWNAMLHPQHPGLWAPRPEDVPMWERLLRTAWGLGEAPVSLAVESLQVSPARAVVEVFPHSPVTVYADGLMSYGPTRSKLPPAIGGRIDRLLHLDLVPGLRPLLLSEFGVEPESVPDARFTAVLDEVTAESVPGPAREDGEGPALLLGQYLSALGILSPAEEDALHLRMLRGAAAAGHRSAVFKPHPSAPPSGVERLEEEAAELGVELTVHQEPVLAEALFRTLRPALVVGCFSTALFTASAYYGLPVARVGTELLLERLTPYQNSNRIPVTLADALLPDLERPDTEPAFAAAGAGELVAAVGYCMQAKVLPGLRERAAAFLAVHPESGRRYVKRRRLTSLGLPGGVQGRVLVPRNRVTRKAARMARKVASASRSGSASRAASSGAS